MHERKQTFNSISANRPPNTYRLALFKAELRYNIHCICQNAYALKYADQVHPGMIPLLFHSVNPL